MAATVKRQPVKFIPNPKRVITRYFMPGSPERAKSVIRRVLKLSDDENHRALDHVLREFSQRHRNITKVFEGNFDNLKSTLENSDISLENLPVERKLLIGSYFTMEFSIESAAFFNYWF